MMTRRDFERLAKAARVIRPMVADAVYDELIEQLALACSDMSQHDHFNYDKFWNACWEESDGVRPLPVANL